MGNPMHFTDPKVLNGLRVIGRGDVTLGVVEGVYADIRSGHPQWVAIRSGLFGTDVSLVPLIRAERSDRSLRIPYGAQEPQGRSAPCARHPLLICDYSADIEPAIDGAHVAGDPPQAQTTDSSGPPRGSRARRAPGHVRCPVGACQDLLCLGQALVSGDRPS
jgi:hypothetical protein